MNCPNCGSVLPDNAKFCTNCGQSAQAQFTEEIEKTQTIPKVQPAPAPVASSEQPAAASRPEPVRPFTPLTPQTQDAPVLQTEDTPQKSGSKAPLIIALCAAGTLVIAAVIAAILVFMPKDKASAPNTPTHTEQQTEQQNTDENTSYEKSNKADKKKKEKDKNLLLKKSEAAVYDINVFLSNFIETGLESYSEDTVASKSGWYGLVDFAYYHALINNPGVTYTQNGKIGIAADKVDEILNKYMGVTVPHQNAYLSSEVFWDYEDGYFWHNAKSGYAHDYFSLAESMEDNGDGTYTIKFKSFYAGTAGTAPQDWYSCDLKAAEDMYTPVSQGTAIVREKSYNGTQTYELIELY